MKNLNRLLIFAKVVESKSFSKAAQQLGIGKSAVSMQVSQLEAELGVQLLHRSTRQLALTEVGEQYYFSCARIAEEVALASEQIKHYSKAVSGTLKLTCPVGFGNRVISPMLSEFIAQYPDLDIDMTLSDDNINLVERGLDLAIRVAPLADSSLIAKPLINAELLLCASPSYIEEYGVPQSIEALNEHQWVLFTHTPNRFQFTHKSKQYDIQPKGQVRVNNEQARLQLVLDGLGLSIMHAYDAWEYIQNGQLIKIPFDYPIPPTPVTALYQSRKFLPKKTTVFIAFLREHIKKQAWKAA